MDILRLGETELDLGERRVRRPGAPECRLTVLEANFLRYLAQRRGATVEREELLARVWGYAPTVVSRAVDNTVARVRQKIEADAAFPRWLTSTRGGGYRLEPEPSVTPPLPGEGASFVGREDEIEQVRRAVGADRVVALVGLGGIGKSRIALRAAQSFVAGGGEAVVVALVGARDRAEALGRIGSALGIGADQVGGALEGRTELLLVLDEVEHLANDDLAELIGLDGPRFLLTSQRPVEGALGIEVGPLSLAEATELVVARSPVPISHDDAALVAAAVDRVPFVAELAARWLAVGGAAEVVARLDALRGQGPGRHDTVAAALSGSWALLEPAGRALLGDAALFVGTFTVGDLESVTGPGDVLTEAAELVARGWLQRAPDGLTVLSVVRRFLAENGRIPADGPARMARWLLGWAPDAASALARRWDPALDARLHRAQPELRRALDVVEGDDAVRLLIALHHRPTSGSVPFTRVFEEIDRVAATLSDSSDLWPRLLLIRANFLVSAGALDRAHADLVLARDRYEQTTAPDDHGRGAFAGAFGNLCLNRGDRAGALELYREAIVRLTAAGAEAGAATFRLNFAAVVGRTDPALEEALIVDALGTLSGVANPTLIGMAHCNLANLYNGQGKAEAAASHYERAKVLLEAAGDRNALGRTLANQAWSRLDHGDLRGAWATAEQAKGMLRAIGARAGEGRVRLTQSRIRLEEGHAAEALELAMGVDADLERHRLPESRPMARWRAGQALLWLGRTALSLEALEAASSGGRGGTPIPEAGVDLALIELSTDPVQARRRIAGITGPARALLDALIEGSPVPTLAGGSDVRTWRALARRTLASRDTR